MKYRRPSRLRRIAKWVGLGVCVVILCIWIISYWSVIGYLSQAVNIQVSAGWLIVSVPLYSGTHFGPLSVPLIALAIPTAILWLRDRRIVPFGHCLHCGYNLTGNESGKCPECATPVPKQESVPCENAIRRKV